MPFKWRLKKTKRYEISTKNAFIVGVYLLDNSFLECTLTSDSTGRECLESIGQRIELAEVSKKRFYCAIFFLTYFLQALNFVHVYSTIIQCFCFHRSNNVDFFFKE